MIEWVLSIVLSGVLLLLQNPCVPRAWMIKCALNKTYTRPLYSVAVSGMLQAQTVKSLPEEYIVLSKEINKPQNANVAFRTPHAQ